MNLSDYPRQSYRNDASDPEWQSSKPLFLFDGHCALCSGGVRWLMRFDRQAKVNIASAQSMTGQAIFNRYGKAMDESYLLIVDGQAYEKSAGYLRLLGILGGPWHLLRLAALIPPTLRNWVYDIVARNRYRWFGKTGYCEMLNEEQKKRLIDV